MSHDKKELKELTVKFIHEFIELSGESPTFAINVILPPIMYPLLPQYEDSSYELYLPMSYFEANMANEGLGYRLKGWTNNLIDIAITLESDNKMDFDRYRFENFTEKEVEEEVLKITCYETLKCEKQLETFKVKSFDIVSTTNYFKGTVSLTYRNESELYPVKDVMLICNGKCIFNWSIYEENGEKTMRTVDANNIKDLNSFYYYTAQ